MRVIRETCVAGSVIDVTVRVPSGNHRKQRAQKKNITKEKVEKNNDRMAAKHLTRMLNANFDKKCWHDTLTHAKEQKPEEAARTLRNFIARARRMCKKLGIEFKWVAVTEYLNERIHHHFVTNAPLEVIKKCWKDGHVLPRPLDDGPNYGKLAEYFIKETTKTFRMGNSPFGSRYTHSRNLIIPVPQIEEVSEKQLFGEPVARKGYYIDQDSVRRYEHPITGLEHLEYIMVSLDEEPRIKKYYKGKKKTREESYSKYINYEEEQQSLWK